MSIWVCGEVLIDILPTGPVVGGGPANTAKALARLGYEVDFIDGISSDTYGVSARKELEQDGVGLGLALEVKTLELESLSQKEAIEIGEIALDMGFARGLGIAVEVRLKEWIVFHASLPGSTADNDSWIARKARVVLATGNSTMYE